MFAVIYRAYTRPGYDKQYQDCWNKIATYFVKKRGALGSCLHKTEDGMWLAYSRWPDRATRDASWPGDDTPAEALPEDIKQAIIDIKDTIDEARKLDDITMDMGDDLL